MNARSGRMAVFCTMFAAMVAAAQTPRDKIAEVIEPILKNPPHSGLLVWDVLPKLQAEKAGIRVGDVITHYDGKPVRTVDQLQRVARAAAEESRANLLVVAQRGGQKIDAEFDPAPMGVRLVSLSKDEKRTLWRPATQYQPNYKSVQRLMDVKHRWDLAYFGTKPVGWAHTYCTSQGDVAAYRVQSQSKSDDFTEKRDVMFTFAPNAPLLTPRSLRMVVNDRIILTAVNRQNILVGERSGIRDSAPLPPDAMAMDLAGLVAGTMPKKVGACVRCSLLPSGSLHTAPFADLCCIGAERITVEGSSYAAWCFETTEFGKNVGRYWVDGSGEVLQMQFGSGFKVVRSTSTAVGLAFPKSMSEFPPIERLPALESAPFAAGN